MAAIAQIEFDLDKTYDENLEVLKIHAATIDAPFAEILFRHLDKLMAADDPGNRANRAEFNRAVLAELEASLSQSQGTPQ